MQIGQQNPIYGLVKILNDSSIQILLIDNEFFTVEEFFPSDRNTPYHRLRGKHITKIINDHMNIGIADPLPVIQKIEREPSRDLQYSGDYSWKWMIR